MLRNKVRDTVLRSRALGTGINLGSTDALSYAEKQVANTDNIAMMNTGQKATALPQLLTISWAFIASDDKTDY